MSYYTNLFSPETYETFSRSDQTISGFRTRQQNAASRVRPGDRLICYMTKLSRWVGVLEVLSDYFLDDTPIFYPEDDPFIVRFKVKPIVWLPKEKAVPIHEDKVWHNLSFTREHNKQSTIWTGKVRGSLVPLSTADGQLLEKLMLEQQGSGETFPVDEDKYQKYVPQQIRRPDGVVSVTVPQDEDEETAALTKEDSVRDSAKIQALLAKCGEKMGFKVWLPKSDRNAVLKEWKPSNDVLLDVLPLNYNEPTLQTIENIDVLWLKGRAIMRAFEVEHTTAVYSGILRMADLMALQPNMDIKLHIVAPTGRKDKVYSEIRRPVFSLLDRGPLSKYCTFISYDSVQELAKLKHLSHLSDSVIEEYAEEAD